MSDAPEQVVVGVFPAEGASQALAKIRAANKANWIDPIKSAIVVHKQDGTIDVQPASDAEPHGLGHRIKGHVIDKKRNEAMQKVGQSIPAGTSAIVSVTAESLIPAAQEALTEQGAAGVKVQPMPQ
jgi:hypothetical protein